jgi:hypothetical protein
MTTYNIKALIDHISTQIIDPLTTAYITGKRLEAEAIVKAAEVRAEAQHHEAEARITAANIFSS